MHYLTILGLVFDVIGVILLGIDLIRLQRATKDRAKEGRAMFDEIEEEYGGIESWADEIKRYSGGILDCREHMICPVLLL